MAVQAQYASNVLFLNRSEQEQRNKDMDYNQQQQQQQQPSPVFFSNGAMGNGNMKKRPREALMAPTHHPINVFSLQSQPSIPSVPSPSLISLSQLQLRLSLEEQNQNQNQNQNQQICSPLMSTFFSDEVSAQINQQKEEMDQFVLAQGEQLRRTLAEKRQRHYRALLGAAEESASRRLKEKEAELERAARRAAELEDRLARLRTESMAWQAKAMSEQAAAASLQAQLQHAAASASVAPPMIDECGESPAEDAESAHVDPDRLERRPGRTCQVCRVSAVSVVVLPCRHLCLCAGCDTVTTRECCPVCRCTRTGSVQVFFS